MLVIVPTNDWISVAPDIEKTSGFRYMIIRNGDVISEELLNVGNSKPGEILTEISHKVNSKWNDKLKTIILMNDLRPGRPIPDGYNIFHPANKNITNALNEYLTAYTIAESDYCCMP